MFDDSDAVAGVGRPFALNLRSADGFDLFTSWAPLDLISKGGADEPIDVTPGIVDGIASAELEDQQRDVLAQDGMDWSYCLSKGFLNNDHAKGIGGVVGVPLEVYKTTYKGVPATGLRSQLLMGDPQATAIWNKAVALKKSGVPRKLGYSVEGVALERDGRRVVRSKIYNVAITAHPVLPDARLEALAKSAMGSASAGYQTPASMGASAGSMAPHHASSLSSVVSNATFKGDKSRMVSVDEVKRMVMLKWPSMGEKRALILAQKLVRYAKRK